MNTAIAERPNGSVARQEGARTILDVIADAVRDPAVDVNKMERLFAMHQEAQKVEARKAYTAAMVAMKPKLPVIDRKGKIEVRKKGASGERDGEIQQSTAFARWEDIDEAISDTLAEHGFALTFRTGNMPDGRITVTGILSHIDGHSEESTMALPLDTTGSKNNVQAAGSSTSYGKRYTATMLLNIRTRGEDDDGKAGGLEGTIPRDKVDDIITRLNYCDGDIPAFCTFMKVDSVSDILVKDLPRALNAVEKKEQAFKKAKAPV